MENIKKEDRKEDLQKGRKISDIYIYIYIYIYVCVCVYNKKR